MNLHFARVSRRENRRFVAAVLYRARRRMRGLHVREPFRQTFRRIPLFRRARPAHRGKRAGRSARSAAGALEADVNFKVVKDFVESVREKCLGQETLKGVSPAQQVVKIVNDELVSLLGGETTGLNLQGREPAVIMLVGLQGSGKTTSAGKIANLCAGRKCGLIWSRRTSTARRPSTSSRCWPGSSTCPASPPPRR